MTTPEEFFFSSPPSVVRLDCLEISHPDFSQTYRIVRNAPEGITAVVADDPVDYDYYPVRVLPMASTDDLVQALAVTLGDVGDVIAAEIENIWDANGMNTRPTLTYHAFRSDDLSAPIEGSERVLEIVSVTTSKEGCTFEARAPELNASRTGELYTVERFPMLRGFT